METEQLQLVASTHPALKQRAIEVADTYEARREAEEMAESMLDLVHEHNALGLAANQVGVLKRVVVIRAPGRPIRIAINPAFSWMKEGRTSAKEACLSCPGTIVRVARYNEITVFWTDPAGRRHSADVSGLEARIWQHEIDHLDGISIVDKI